MKILEVRALAIRDVKVLRFGRFTDKRGYFTETYRYGDLVSHPQLSFLAPSLFVQVNESYSRKGTIRGLHFQWDPPMGKLVRPLAGRLVDIAVDIRKGSPTWGKGLMYDMPADRTQEYSEWIWIPPGFAHGTCFPEESVIEYFCTAQYNPAGEACISPFAPDLDWSLCEPDLKALFDNIAKDSDLISDRDKCGFTLAEWTRDARSEHFCFGGSA
ncbi:MAG: dTDP-4-dehydrorhamnose 3,5-epimerase family protein, partial [Kiritimatiellia bacterium]